MGRLTFHYNSVLVALILLSSDSVNAKKSIVPLVINTWAFTNATQKAWEVINTPDKNAIDAVVEGCTTCEDEQCDGTVGYGGSPDENGETTLDSLVFDGDLMAMGSVGGLRRIKHAAKTAMHVMKYTEHSILVGDLATDFAKSMGFEEENLSTDSSISMWKQWKNGHCQPNFWFDVTPQSSEFCGPYKPVSDHSNEIFSARTIREINSWNHDTISMAAIDVQGSIAVATSSNGAKFKVPGRVGDAPLPGAGAYADSSVGAALATGDGDVMMRFLPTFLIVEMMRGGASPKAAATEAISRIAKYYPTFSGALIAVNKEGKFHAACHGIPVFPFSIVNANTNSVQVLTTKCLKF